MKKEFERSFLVEAIPAEVWEFLWNIEAVARCIPGCAEVQAIDPGSTYRAVVQRKLGPFKLSVTLDIEVLEAVAPSLLRVAIRGNDRKLKSEVQQLVTVQLQSTSEHETAVQIAATIEMSGVLASLGGNLIQLQLDQVMDDFVEALRREISATKNPSGIQP